MVRMSWDLCFSSVLLLQLSMLQAEEFEFAEDDTVDADCADGSETEPPRA